MSEVNGHHLPRYTHRYRSFEYSFDLICGRDSIVDDGSPLTIETTMKITE